jgi:hypothetical protein
MIEDEIHRLETEIEAMKQEERALRAKRDAKMLELEKAMLAFATANPHPWVGKRVKRVEGIGYFGRQTRTIRGTVETWSRAKFGHLRGRKSFHPPLKEGETVVVSHTRKTVWKFEGLSLRQHETAWEIEE